MHGLSTARRRLILDDFARKGLIANSVNIEGHLVSVIDNDCLLALQEVAWPVWAKRVPLALDVLDERRALSC